MEMSDEKKVTKMSPESRSQLVGLVNKTAEYVADGHNPTDALVKAGSEGSYPPDYIYRAAEAYNGAAHLNHLKQAGYEARGDSFNLADGKEALIQILGSRPETDKQAYFVDLFSDDTRYFEELTPERAKAASSDHLPSITVKQAVDNSERLRDIEARGVDKTKEKLSEVVDALKDTLRLARYQVSTADPVRVNKMASEFLTFNDADAADIILETTSMPSEEVQKLSSFDFAAVKPEDELYSTLDNCLLLKRAALDIHQDLATKEAEHYCNSLERAELVYDLLGVEKKATPGFDFDSIPVEGEADDLNKLLSKEASLLTGLGAGVGAGLTTSTLDKAEDAHKKDTEDGGLAQTQGLKSLLDPAFLEEAQRIELAKKMHSVLRDPVIASSGASAQEIQEALYELTAMAPSAKQYVPLLRSMLRRRLESRDRLDPFDISQILTTNQSLQGRALK